MDSTLCPDCGQYMADVTSLASSFQQLKCVNAMCGLSNDDLAPVYAAGRMLLDAFCLHGQSVTEIALRFRAGQMPEVTIHRLVTVGQLKGLQKVVEDFRLVPRESVDTGALAAPGE